MGSALLLVLIQSFSVLSIAGKDAPLILCRPGENGLLNIVKTNVIVDGKLLTTISGEESKELFLAQGTHEI